MVDIEIVVPISISGVWIPRFHELPEYTGSLGIALVLEPPIIAMPRKSGLKLIYNNYIISNFPNLNILKNLGELSLIIESKVPLGYGYGVSASISLAYALAAYEYGYADLKRALITAHVSEVVNKNGLGDVIVQWAGGGLVYRKKPGAPFIGEVEKIDTNFKGLIYSKPLEKIPTSTIIRETPAEDLINEFLKFKSIEKFFEVARKFNERLGFITEYPNSFRKKGVIVILGNPTLSESWIKHNLAKYGAYVR
ncbi:MAG: GHMP kinase [Sulfolobaceae archaeon]